MTNKYPQKIATDIYGVELYEPKIAHFKLTKEQAAALDADGILDGTTTSSSAATTITTFAAQPPYPRTITVVASDSTSAHVKADSTCTITGTNIKDQPISEVLTFEADQSTAEETAKAFKTITKIVFSKMDGAAKFDVGWGDKLGLPFMFSVKPLCIAYQADALETTSPTITIDDNEIEKNTIDLYTALDSAKAVDVMFFL